MKTIYRDEYPNDGIFINLETDYNYEDLIYNHYAYLRKDEKYYVWCLRGGKSKIVVEELLRLGYNAIKVISR